MIWDQIGFGKTCVDDFIRFLISGLKIRVSSFDVVVRFYSRVMVLYLCNGCM